VILRGAVEAGSGQAGSFMSLDWVRRAVSDTIGFDPWPGTLNVRVLDEPLEEWREIRRDHAVPLAMPPEASCGARLVPVMVSTDIPAAVIIPDLTRYGAHVLEVIAPVHLRSRLWLRNDDVLALTWTKPRAGSS
jgi:riboflavin kinase